MHAYSKKLTLGICSKRQLESQSNFISLSSDHNQKLFTCFVIHLIVLIIFGLVSTDSLGEGVLHNRRMENFADPL